MKSYSMYALQKIKTIITKLYTEELNLSPEEKGLLIAVLEQQITETIKFYFEHHLKIDFVKHFLYLDSTVKSICRKLEKQKRKHKNR